MNDRGLSVLEQYNLKVQKTYRGRGSLICETDQGLKLIKEYNSSKLKLAFQNKVLKQVRKSGYKKVDLILENVEGEIVSTDKDDVPYIVKDWFDGRECDTKNEKDILSAARNLAELHKVMKVIPDVQDSSSESTVYNSDLRTCQSGPMGVNVIYNDIEVEFEKHNRELKKVRNFIRDKHKKNEFELSFMLEFQVFYEQGQEVLHMLNESNYAQLRDNCIKAGQVCHGEYNHHNVLFIKEGMAVTNFDKCGYDLYIGDLYNFMRKILEKHNWNDRLGKSILEEYDRNRPISSDELMNLYYRLSYPEKFWKMANHYYNSNKAWIPDKNVEKINKLVKQDNFRIKFLNNML